MKLLILVALLATSSLTHAATDGADRKNALIGFCGAYKLILKDYDGAASVANMSTELPLTQFSAKQYIALAKADIAQAVEVGKKSCKAIGR